MPDGRASQFGLAIVSENTTYEGLCSREPETSAVHTCYQDGPSTNCFGERLSHVQGFSIRLEFRMGSSGHFRSV